MDTKALDHAYHRSRVDSHIGGSIVFIFIVVGLAFIVGDKFKPFQEGADIWASTLLVWQADTNAWVPAYPNVLSELSAPSKKYKLTKEGDTLTLAANDAAQLITRQVYPRSYSLVVTLGSLIAAFYLYGCARRQTYLMNAVYSEDDEDRPYDRPWEEVRITFWALFVVLLGALFLFLL